MVRKWGVEYGCVAYIYAPSYEPRPLFRYPLPGVAVTCGSAATSSPLLGGTGNTTQPSPESNRFGLKMSAYGGICPFARFARQNDE